MPTRFIVLALGLLLALAGCAQSTAGGGPRLNASVISRAEIEELGPSNAYEIVQKLRNNWLQKRGRTSFVAEGEIKVYQDRVHVGGLDALRGMHSDNIESIRFLDERQANFRFGSGHEHGAILVTLRR